MKRLLLLLAALLAAWLAVAATEDTAAAVLPANPAFVHVYNHDSNWAAASFGNTVTERGLPAPYESGSPGDAGDLRSSGRSPRPGTTAKYGYNGRSCSGKIDRDGTSTLGPSAATRLSSVGIVRWEVGAETAPELASGLERTGAALSKSDAFHRSVSAR